MIDPLAVEDGIHQDESGHYFAVYGGHLSEVCLTREDAERALARLELDELQAQRRPADPSNPLEALFGRPRQEVQHTLPDELYQKAIRWAAKDNRSLFVYGDILHQNEFGCLHAMKHPDAVVVFLHYIERGKLFPDAQPHQAQFQIEGDCVVAFLDGDGDWVRLAVDSRTFDHFGKDQ